MTVFPLFIFLASVFGVSIGTVVWWLVRQSRHNYKQYVIYNRIANQLHNGLANDQLSWEEFSILMNLVRETHNESLRGKDGRKYFMPLLSTHQSAEEVTPTPDAPQPQFRRPRTSH